MSDDNQKERDLKPLFVVVLISLIVSLPLCFMSAQSFFSLMGLAPVLGMYLVVLVLLLLTPASTKKKLPLIVIMHLPVASLAAGMAYFNHRHAVEFQTAQDLVLRIKAFIATERRLPESPADRESVGLESDAVFEGAPENYALRFGHWIYNSEEERLEDGRK